MTEFKHAKELTILERIIMSVVLVLCIPLVTAGTIITAVISIFVLPVMIMTGKLDFTKLPRGTRR